MQHLDGAVYEGVFCTPWAPSPADANADAEYSFSLKMAQRRGADGVRNLNPYLVEIVIKSTQYL